jgi:hypothetical protein
MATYNFSKGSEWRKWDLHVHSNASDGKATPEEIIEEAKNQEISVLAITDHHTAKNVDILKKLGMEKGIKVIAGIEFRTEYGQKSVHMIGLFPDNNNGRELTEEVLHESILCPLGLSKSTIIQKGKDKKNKNITNEEAFKEGMFLVQVEFKKAADLIHENGGLVSVHAGRKANTIEEMKHEGKSPQNVKYLYDSLGTVKDDLLKNFIDICEIKEKGDSKEFYREKFGKPVITASDAHRKDEIGKNFTWIKADTTFEGLKQILYEPESRIKIQPLKPINKKSYNTIKKIKFTSSSGDDKFTNKEIGFNPDLNAIIGGKSSGKSLLMHAIAKTVGNTNYDEKYGNILSNVDLDIYYADNPKTKRTKNDNRIIEFLPQLHIEKIVRDRSNTSNEFNDFIKDLTCQDEGISDIYKNHDDIISKEESKLELDIKAWTELDKQLFDSKHKLKALGDKRAISAEVSKLEEKIKESTKNAGLSDEDTKEYYKLVELNKTKQERMNKLIAYETEIINMKKYINNETLFSNILGILVFETKHKFISNLFTDIKNKIRKSLKSDIDNFTKELEKKLTKIQKIYKKLSEQKVNNEKKLLPILERTKIRSEIETIKKNIETENDNLKKIESKESEIECLQKKRDEYANGFINHYCNTIESYKNTVKSINDIIQKRWQDDQIQMTLIASSEFNSKMFTEAISSVINVQSHLNNQFSDCGFNTSDYEFSEKTHVENIDKMLKMILKDENRFNNFKKNGNTESLLRSLLKNYNYINFDIKKGSDSLHNMSEGKKGIIILQLYLSLSKSDCPILIDQPEDNLDNRTIYVELNDYIKQCKRRRQIIMISHNANLVVNTDAENVIVANQSGENNNKNNKFKFEYVNGSLENTFSKPEEKGILYQKGIKEHVCEILEGGIEAFKKREKKYDI